MHAASTDELDRLPPTVRLIAGFAHEKQPIAEQQQIQQRIDGHLGITADVAAACGLGRRTRQDAEANLRRVAELATT
jgi:hypothetical protein